MIKPILYRLFSLGHPVEQDLKCNKERDQSKLHRDGLDDTSLFTRSFTFELFLKLMSHIYESSKEHIFVIYKWYSKDQSVIFRMLNSLLI